MFFVSPFWQPFLFELCGGGCIYLVYVGSLFWRLFLIYILFFTYPKNFPNTGHLDFDPQKIYSHALVEGNLLAKRLVKWM